MPARIVIVINAVELASLLSAEANQPLPALKPRYNVAPQQAIPVIRLVNGTRELASLKWGLIPYWSAEQTHSGHVNARAETVSRLPSFRDSFRSRRCLVPASGLYGWKAGGKRKQPHYFRPAGGGMFLCAAIWDRWEGPDGLLESVAVLTMPANDLIRPMDERMPVIFSERQLAAWLDPGDKEPAKLLKSLGPYPPEQMECWPVSTRVNSPEEDDPDLLAPIGQSLQRT